ncbi:hypothetical protein [Stappia stellulata]|uniref:hypothetical protein n=1 Tax=Stappia stellulata TaxID=71235 RepID=UPI00041C0FD5|nr:hypothetical protein [Stappia stellulata]
MLTRALPMAISATSRDIRGIYRRAKRNAVLNGLAAVCFATAYVAGLIAIGAYLVPIYGPGVSALLVAGAMAAVGTLILLVVAILRRREKRRQARRQAAQRLTAAAALSVLPQLTKSKSLLLVAAAGGLAFLLSRGRDDDGDA